MGDTCRLISVIETTLLRRGKGSGSDPHRIITQYWSTDGKLLAEVDPKDQPQAQEGDDYSFVKVTV